MTMNDDYQKELARIEQEAWLARTQGEQEHFLIPINVCGHILPLKEYRDIEGLCFTTFTEPNSCLDYNTVVYVAGWAYETKEGKSFVAEAAFLERHHAQRRLFELKREWREKSVVVEELEPDNHDHITAKALHQDWYNTVSPKFKISIVIVNPRN